MSFTLFNWSTTVLVILKKIILEERDLQRLCCNEQLPLSTASLSVIIHTPLFLRHNGWY